MKTTNHPVPKKYHKLLHIGEKSRKGGIIDFKVPPVIVDSTVSILAHKETVLGEHVDIKSLPLAHPESKCFLILRPTALQYRLFVSDQLMDSGLAIHDEFELENFMRLADVLYQLDLAKPYHWQWRVIMKILHESGVQNQNKAFAFVIEDDDEAVSGRVSRLKNKIRLDLGETPIIVEQGGVPKIALGIHHLHSPDASEVPVEYNALMHAKNKTSVFSALRRHESNPLPA